MLGPRSYSQVNDAGIELLLCLLCNKVAVCNTWPEKKNIHKQMQQHPKLKNGIV